MSKALLICNGEKPGVWLKKLAKQADFILAADGGVDAALKVGIIPQAVIGDLDSVSPRTQKCLKDTAFIEIKRQDNTDLEKALDWLIDQGFTQIMIAGAVGDRLDFTIGNVLLVRPYLKHAQICFCGPDWTIYPRLNGGTFSAQKGARLSLIPLSYCRGVTLTGCRYTLNHENIGRQYVGRTLSNQVTSSKISISFLTGFLLIYVENTPQKKRI